MSSNTQQFSLEQVQGQIRYDEAGLVPAWSIRRVRHAILARKRAFTAALPFRDRSNRPKGAVRRAKEDTALRCWRSSSR
ncbi:hypothetical protein [Paenibacillus sp. AR247]|uniref:hypothetical protein n=1 Tax=Paenibacillus sp. AR247 TaxID=1631599 RepID=UPI0026B2D5E8